MTASLVVLELRFDVVSIGVAIPAATAFNWFVMA
jgi:hypothetical protein